ncbi:hypothetical protein E2C01_092821 [Portunus trituberculatus]|uniref:Uncharacterized protein n=1 Tax=Portunus trituberculatus TaxID=210409 RepID=A0A5B7JSX2_PORTR|nr:hypothetical protein [Portunus trituberculatus]
MDLILNALKDNTSYNQLYDHHHHHLDHSSHTPKSNHHHNNNNKESNHRKRQTQAEDHVNTAQEIGAVDRIFQGESICGACSLLAKLVVGYLKIGAPVDFMANVLVKICYVVAYKSLPVCRGIIFQDKVCFWCVLLFFNCFG